MVEVFSSSLRQNNLGKTIAQIFHYLWSLFAHHLSHFEFGFYGESLLTFIAIHGVECIFSD